MYISFLSQATVRVSQAKTTYNPLIRFHPVISFTYVTALQYHLVNHISGYSLHLLQKKHDSVANKLMRLVTFLTFYFSAEHVCSSPASSFFAVNKLPTAHCEEQRLASLLGGLLAAAAEGYEASCACVYDFNLLVDIGLEAEI